MRVLVTAASKHTATAEIAAAIVRTLSERGVEAVHLEPDEVTAVEGYDAVVLGSATYMGRWLEPARALVDRLADELAARPVWLFSSGPIGDPPRPEEDPADVAEISARLAAREHRNFPGKLDRGALGFGEKAIVKLFRAPDGDYRDWAAIEGWAADIAATLQTDAAPA